MKVLSLLLMFGFFFVFAAEAQSSIKLKIGEKVASKIAGKSEGQIASSPSQFRPYIKKTISKVDYIIAFEEKSRKIRFIQTLDRDFRTAKGLRVGSRITVTRQQLSIYPGWYIFAPAAPDGWKPIVGSDSDIGIIGGNPENSLTDLKDGERKTVRIMGFVKGGN